MISKQGCRLWRSKPQSISDKQQSTFFSPDSTLSGIAPLWPVPEQTPSSWETRPLKNAWMARASFLSPILHLFDKPPLFFSSSSPERLASPLHVQAWSRRSSALLQTLVTLLLTRLAQPAALHPSQIRAVSDASCAPAGKFRTPPLVPTAHLTLISASALTCGDGLNRSSSASSV